MKLLTVAALSLGTLLVAGAASAQDYGYGRGYYRGGYERGEGWHHRWHGRGW